MPKKEVSKQGRNGGGAIPSPKLGTMVYYRNRIKRDYIRLLNYDSDVEAFEEWPCTITYRVDERAYICTPDFSVSRRQSVPSIVVCTKQANVNDPQYFPRWTACQMWCQNHGYEFNIVTEVVLLPYQPLISNLKRLAVHANRAIPPQAYEYLMRTLMQELPPLSVAEIVQRTPLLDTTRTRSYLWHLLATGVLVTDLTIPLNVQTTRISWNRGRRMTE